MKAAKVIARRRTPSGDIAIQIVCPVCDRRHWLPMADEGQCPRRFGRFAISERSR